MSKNLIAALVSIILFASVIGPLFFWDQLYPMSAPLMKKIEPKEETQFSQQYFALIQSHDLATAAKYIDPKFADVEFQNALVGIADSFPNETPKSIKFIAAKSIDANGTMSTDITSEYEFSNKWLLADLALQKQGDTFLIQGIHVMPIAYSVEDQTKFYFKRQDTKHYIVFILALLVLAFDIVALVLCIKTPIAKRKWLWIIFILVGFSAINFNWATGAIHFAPLSVSVPIVKFSQMFYQPFYVNIFIPLGAIVFLLKRRKWLT